MLKYLVAMSSDHRMRYLDLGFDLAQLLLSRGQVSIGLGQSLPLGLHVTEHRVEVDNVDCPGAEAWKNGREGEREGGKKEKGKGVREGGREGGRGRGKGGRTRDIGGEEGKRGDIRGGGGGEKENGDGVSKGIHLEKLSLGKQSGMLLTGG